MDSPAPARPKTLNLAPGAQAVINGAIVTAAESCRLNVEPGAFVLVSGLPTPERAKVHDARQELYLSLLDLIRRPRADDEETIRLFRLLSDVAAQGTDQEAKQDCMTCCSALMAGRLVEASRPAARLASSSLAAAKRKTPLASATREVIEASAGNPRGFVNTQP